MSFSVRCREACAHTFAARHKLVDWYRRHDAAVTRPLDDDTLLFGEGDYDAATAPADVSNLLEGLPERQASAIRCMKLEGLSVSQTAERTGQSAASVKVNVHRGLRNLAARLRGYRT